MARLSDGPASRRELPPFAQRLLVCGERRSGRSVNARTRPLCPHTRFTRGANGCRGSSCPALLLVDRGPQPVHAVLTRLSKAASRIVNVLDGVCPRGSELPRDCAVHDTGERQHPNGDKGYRNVRVGLGVVFLEVRPSAAICHLQYAAKSHASDVVDPANHTKLAIPAKRNAALASVTLPMS